MRKSFIVLLTLFALTACSAASNEPTDPKVYAQQIIQKAGKNAKITKVVTGDKKYRKADDLWCVETDANSQDGQIPYLLAVWRKDNKWDGTELADGWYEWDLYGCPR